MKHLLLIISIAAALGLTAQAIPPYQLNVGPVSKTLLPVRGMRSAQNWTNTMDVSEGEYVAVGSRIYMALSAGVSTQAPANASGVTSADAVRWLYVEAGRRSGFSIVNDSTTTVYIAIGAPSVAGAGVRLNADGGAWTCIGDYVPQDFFTVIGAASGSVGAVEW